MAHDICDLYAEVKAMVDVTNPPTDLYSQADFKRRDVVLTFHDATYSWASSNRPVRFPGALSGLAR